MVGEEVNEDELSLMELLLTNPEDDVFGARHVDADFPPTIFSDIFGGTVGAIFPEWGSIFCEESLHLQPVAVHL